MKIFSTLLLQHASYLLVLSATLLSAQPHPLPCGSSVNLVTDDVLYRNLPPASGLTTTNLYTVPVVFHILHTGGTENVPDSVVFNWLNNLNQRFANMVPFYDTSGVDIDIEFCLATVDTNGNPTNGIDRHYTPMSNMPLFAINNGLPATFPVFDSVAAVYHWNTLKYFNIYIVKSLAINGIQYSGYGWWYTNHGQRYDGIYITYLSNLSVDLLLPHEAGHYLGLSHTFQSGCANLNCLLYGDGVCDTPPDSIGIGTCTPTNSCQSDDDDTSANNPFRPVALGGIGDQNDDNTNYMDYACVKHYTSGQKTRMQSVLTNFRGSLLSLNGCGVPSGATQQTLFEQSLKVFPNPVVDNVTFKNYYAPIQTVVIYDMRGNELHRLHSNDISATLNLSELGKGIYLYKVTAPGNILFYGKLVK